jgi:hypothetical protein
VPKAVRARRVNNFGMVHHPDSSFVAAEVAQLARRQDVVIFHCMESARRGPRCARRLHDYWCQQPYPPPQRRPRLCVLQGGADLWVRRFYRDTSMVSGFDPDYWGFGEESGGDDGVRAAIHTAASHVKYVRPADQQATPWSAAGGAAAVASCLAAVLTESYLCNVCSCHIMTTATPCSFCNHSRAWALIF